MESVSNQGQWGLKPFSSQAFVKDVLKSLPQGAQQISGQSTKAFAPALTAQAKQVLSEVLGNDPKTVTFGEAATNKRIGLGEGLEQGKDKTLSDLLGDFVGYVDAKDKTAQEETFKVLSGKTDNLHQSVLATQEAGIAFTMLLEMRNKLVDGCKELMRMSI